MDFSLLYFFIPVFFVVSITPGLCMTLALTMGMSIGLGNTRKMMVGELSGVLLVATVVVVGGGGLMAANPMLLVVFKYVGGAYLLFVGLQMMRSRGVMAVKPDGSVSFDLDFFSLAGQGCITAVANPKGWAFFLAMTPGFINYDVDLGPQMTALVSIILIIEFTSLMLYAAGGQVLGKLLLNSDNVLLLNRVAGALMMCVGIWLATS
jgi:threonine/homoserine/homoserine lactone efflux protein